MTGSLISSSFKSPHPATAASKFQGEFLKGEFKAGLMSTQHCCRLLGDEYEVSPKDRRAGTRHPADGAIL